MIKLSEQNANELMLDMFIFENSQLMQQLEESILESEESSCYTQEAINEIFRIMHTIKGSSAMMMFNNISTLAHTLEDMFYFIREERPRNINCSTISDLVLEGVDFIKLEVEKIKVNQNADGDASALIKNINEYLSALKQENISITFSKEIKKDKTENHEYSNDSNKVGTPAKCNLFKAVIYFEEDCEMENMRAYTVIRNLKNISYEVWYVPDDIIESDNSIGIIRNEGFIVHIKTNLTYEEMYAFLMKTAFLKDLELTELENDDELEMIFGNKKSHDDENSSKLLNLCKQAKTDYSIQERENKHNLDKEIQSCSKQQTIISVNISKLDKLMDLVGEMVIAEAMVIQNPDLKGLELDNFEKSARQLNKITSELQDIVMSIRMVPLATTFHNMHRIVRDMSKKLGKEVQLEIIGEETEVDKNIIEHISDPLMHLVRNSLDHGIESPEDRLAKGKQHTGTITLEAKNAGSDVLITVKDDGKGLDKDKILKKARECGQIYKAEQDMTDKEIYNLIFLPGFSTKDNVSEFSGRGVGMDVVAKNIETVGGSISVESTPGKGSTIILKIPLTLAIIDGMNIKVGDSRYTIPTISIKESFRPKEGDVINDPNGNEMIMVRGQCYSILRLHDLFKVKTDITSFLDGIVIMLEQDEKIFCIFADQLIGQQQVVVKTLPDYIRRFKKMRGIAGCTLLGDGNISLILDIARLLDM